ncbi:Alkaline nuclease [Cacatuid alphaherpesvirus 2]|uniref:Alkaline nuclease n=1 Tax=Cacatuid alphaherpesvirus 2 TaxID=2604840 RepID=A0A5B9R2L4_9ALPH|nr:Alkaline nuclease [Cacatuid alphaherpesvirus 2]QEG54063.1 Alkaline nuclease [Cacatuid alphaherpesvirus 2]
MSQRFGKSCVTDILPSALVPKNMPGINTVTFYDYIKNLIFNGASRESLLSVEPLYHRLAYISKLISWIEDADFSKGILSRLFRSNRPLSAEEVRSSLTPQDIDEILLFVESETKKQVECDLWKVLRQFLITASTLKWVKNKPCSKPDWFKVNDFCRGTPGFFQQNMAITFGLTNESCARKLIVAYVSGQKETNQHTEDSDEFFRLNVGEVTEDLFSCGLMLDKRSGMIGASMDMAIARYDPQTNALDNIVIFEIKCRAKYVFSVDDKTRPLSSLYKKMLSSPSEKTVKNFLFGINSPGVEFFPVGSTPSAAEALVTSSTNWAKSDAKATLRKRGCCIEKRHLHLNKEVSSSIYLFAEPCLENNSIRPIIWPTGKPSCEIPIFINPKHQNFKQIFVQTYVLSDYFPGISISPYLVTFIGRNRTPEELCRVFELTGVREDLTEPIYLDHTHAIPVLLIITPVIIDEEHYNDLKSLGKEAFEFSVQEIWDRVAAATAFPNIGHGCAAKTTPQTE